MYTCFTHAKPDLFVVLPFSGISAACKCVSKQLQLDSKTSDILVMESTVCHPRSIYSLWPAQRYKIGFKLLN